MNIAFIGAGKVGTAFALYLQKNNFKVQGFFSRSFSSSQKSSQITKSKAYENLDDLLRENQIIFITTSDDSIKKVCSLLVEKKLLRKDHLLIHMSGALSSEILQEAANKFSSSIYSLHPLQAFADLSSSLKNLEKTYFSLEGSQDKINILKEMLDVLGNEYFIIEARDKVLYHSAACVVSNYLVAILNLGINLMNQAGIDKEQARKSLEPLILGSVENVIKLSPSKALTGPLARGDIETIEKHLDSIEKSCPEYLDFYKSLALETLSIAKEEQLKNQEKIYYLEKILGGNKNVKKSNC